MVLKDVRPIISELVNMRNGVPLTEDVGRYLPDVRVNVHGEGVRCGIKKALRLIEQAPTIEAQIPKWIPVGAEEKPLHGKEYLCVCTLPDDPEHKWDWMMVLRYYAYGSNGYVDRPHFTDEGVNGMTVTHWTHLPSHPLSE